MKFGYARISTTDQNLDLQIDALQQEGCEKIFQETVSGAKTERVELNGSWSRCAKAMSSWSGS